MGRDRDRARTWESGRKKEKARKKKEVKHQLVIEKTPRITSFLKLDTTKNSKRKIKSNYCDITEPIVSKSSCVNLGSESVNSDSEISTESVDSEIVIDYVLNNTTHKGHESDIKSELEKSNDESSNIPNSNIFDEPAMLNIDRQSNFEPNNEFPEAVKSYSDDIGQWPKKLKKMILIIGSLKEARIVNMMIVTLLHPKIKIAFVEGNISINNMRRQRKNV